MSELKEVAGGVTAPQGFMAAGVHAGLKPSGNADLAMVFSKKPAALAGTFAANRVASAHIGLCRRCVTGKRGQAIVVNSGCANACTGAEGAANAATMARLAAAALGIDEKLALVCSTGVIGVQLPMDKIEAGIKAAAAALSPKGGEKAARAIMTTDTVDKQAARELEIGGKRVRVGGMAKGAGMIAPNMATMLAFLSTDADVGADDLQAVLSPAVAESFNRISVDGCQSTNDTVLMLANGMSGAERIDPGHAQWQEFECAVREVALALALKIVADGEGATKVVTVNVVGAVSDEEARKAARAIADSILVRTSWHGGDPNWGRLMAAIGSSGAYVLEEAVSIAFDDYVVVRNGRLAPGASAPELAKIVARDRFAIRVDFHLGQGSDTVYTCDCSEEYVKINSEYTT